MKRILKISSYYYENNTKVPNIRILGKWLEELGFNVGDKVTIHQEKTDELIIKKAKDIKDR